MEKEFNSDNKLFKEIKDLIIIKGEGNKSISKKIKRALDSKKLTEKEATYLSDLSENDIEKTHKLLEHYENNVMSKKNEEAARAKVKKHSEFLKRQEEINYDINVGGFNPELGFSDFFAAYNSKQYLLKEVENINEINDKTMKDLRILLAEDYMFKADSLEKVKEYTTIINEIGGVLPISVEEKLDKEKLQFFYAQNLKFYLYISIHYKALWKDRLEGKWIRKQTNDYIDLSKEILPAEIIKEEPVFGMYIEKYLFPHFVIPLTKQAGIDIFMKARAGEINSKSMFALGLENTKQKELEDDYIISKVNEMLEINF